MNAHSGPGQSRTTETRRRPRRPRTGRIAVLCAFIVPLAALAFFLAPTGHAGLTKVVQVNGTAISVPSGARVSDLAELSALVARDGPTLDVAGDVTALEGGLPAVRHLDGLSLDDVYHLRDGAVITVRHGGPVAERIYRQSEEIPSETVYAGEGNIVSFVQWGAPGQREFYDGMFSGKRAASLVTTPVTHTVYRLDSTPQPGQKLAALTFDDGPGTHTHSVLDALAARHIPATFFVLGSSASAYPDIIQRMRDEGHEIENHTWSHPWLTKVSAETFNSQIQRTNAVIGGSRYLRPPYGDTNSTVRARAAALGLQLAFWTVDTRDWERQEVEAIMSHVKAETQPGAIILMHDGGDNRLQTVAAVPVIIDWLFEQGYSLTTVDQIL